MLTPVRRLLLWTLICVVSAAPSFIIAAAEFDRAAMVMGVCLFIAAYTLATSTAAFERFHHKPFVRRTLYIGYGMRLVLSLLFPLGLTPVGVGAFPLLPDVWPGFISVQIIESFGIDAQSFTGTLATTIVQGALLNIIIFFFMAIVYVFQRLFFRPPEPDLRGFEVVLTRDTPPT